MKASALTRYGLKQLATNRSRLVMTSFAIVLSVGFMTAALMLGSGYSTVIFGWGESQATGVDLIVEPETTFSGANFEVNPARLGDDVLTDVQNTSGVSAVRPNLWTDNLIRPELPAGDLIPDRLVVTTNGWVDNARLVMVEGSPPGPGQFTMDLDTAAENDYLVGQAYGVTTPAGTRTMELIGLTDFRHEDGTTVGQVLLTFDIDELQEVLGESGYVRLDVDTTEGANVEAVRTSVQQVLPAGVDVLTQAEFQDRLRDQVAPFAQGFRIGLLGFALVSVLVSAFIIYNTFTMLMSQRTREIGLLRAVGASPRQIRRSTTVQSVLLAAVASALGIVVGLGLARALSALLRSVVGLPSPDLPFSPLTVAAALAVGILTTYFASIGPARRASSVPVMTALTDGHVAPPRRTNRRFVMGVMFTIVGVLLLITGAVGAGSTPTTLAAMGGGAVVTLVGIAMLNPLWLAPMSVLLGWPLARFGGVAGRLARQNISRNSRRSATTAASLMVGLGLIALVLVVGQSVKAQVASGAETSYQGDYIVANQLGYKYPINASEELRQLDVVATTTALSFDPISVAGESQYLTVANTTELKGLVDFGRSFESDAASNSVWVSEDQATDENIAIGDMIVVTFLNGTDVSLQVAGLYEDNAASRGNYIIDRSTWFQHTGQTTVDIIVIQSAQSVPENAFRAAMTEFEAANAQIRVESIDGFVDSTRDSINQALGLVNALVALAILISFLGITNTIALSTFERTREIGLLKAIGMKRRQLRRMIRFEAALISLFGALIGAGVGIAFGAAAVAALPSSFADQLSIPIDQIAALVALALVAGVAAAALPAWRAARKPTLDLLASP